MNTKHNIYRQGNIYDLDLYRMLKKCSFSKQEIDRILEALEIHGKKDRFSWEKDDDQEFKQE